MSSFESHVQSLLGLRREFGGRAARDKEAILKMISPAEPDSPEHAAALHEELLFLCAYPDNRAVLAAAERTLRELSRCILKRGVAGDLRNSGIAATPLLGTFSSELLAWLDDRYGNAVRPAWNDESLSDGFDELLPLIVEPAELDGLQHDRVSLREWLRAARGTQRELQWIVARLRRAIRETPLRDHVLDGAELAVEWPALPWSVSRSGLRFPRRLIHFHNDLLRDVSLADWVSRALPSPQRLGRAARREMIDVARLTLAVRERETDPVTYADEREVTLFRLERGVDVALFGMRAEHRLPIESYFGFVAAKNRVPIAYGGGWVFFERCEIGVNLFDTFRGGESALIFSQVMRVYHQHYRATRFTVAPYQFGADNDEAIRSGAFWFYHRLGFRPAEPVLRKVAEREAAKIAQNRGYRTPAPTLRRFTKSPLQMTLGRMDATSRRSVPIDLPRVSFAVSRWIGRAFGGDVRLAKRAARRRLRSAIGARFADIDDPPLPIGPRALLLLLGALPGIEKWSPDERAALHQIYVAKGKPNERKYALAVQDHPRLREALAALSKQR
ncbi:MAG: hypothetical protein JNG88_14000 [Phycisphaerales bacterium]|nr:hypothetical protein [Phycisphaerales bacterium]